MKKLFLSLRVLAAVAVMLVVVACSTEKRVVIISTNDIHSSIDNFPRLATLVEKIRAENGAENVILADAGDRWTGNPFVDHSTDTLYPIVELMNTLDYNIATFGNHEFDWGQAMLNRRTGEMNFPVVCANICTGTSLLSQVEPYKILEAGDLKIAFLGLITSFVDGRPVGKKKSFEGMTFTNPYDTAKKYAWLADECDVFVGLTHLGLAADDSLAKCVPQLDLIIGGHSHDLLTTPRIVGETKITQTERYLAYAGVTTITKKGKTLSIDNHLVRLDTIAPSPTYQKMVDRYNNDPCLNYKIGKVDIAFDTTGVRNLVTDAIRAKTKVDVVLYHKGGIRRKAIDTDSVRRAEIYFIEPFNSEVLTMELSTDDIKEMIINKYNKNKQEDGESHQPDLFPSGLTYEIVTDKVNNAIDVRFSGPKRSHYKVAIPDYIYEEYKFDKPLKKVETGLLVAKILEEYISTHSPLTPDSTPRITIIK
jgi:5'-nucleotidase